MPVSLCEGYSGSVALWEAPSVHLSGLVWSALLTPDCPACACRDAEGRLHINGPLCISVTYLCRVRAAPGPGWFWEVSLYQRLVRSAVERWACGFLHEHACTFLHKYTAVSVGVYAEQ
jgi:hypothetical protein